MRPYSYSDYTPCCNQIQCLYKGWIYYFKECIAAMEVVSIIIFMILFSAEVSCSEGEVQLQDSTSGHSKSCLEWSGLQIENCTVKTYCFLHSDFRCVVIQNLGVACIQTGMCMTYDDVNFLHAGFCPYHPLNITFCRPPLEDFYEVRSSTTLSQLNHIICSPYNREGLLCSQCKAGYGPAVYAFSVMCLKCSENGQGWALHFFLVLFPVTVFYLVIIIFNIRASSPPFAAFVFLCQTFSNIDRIHVPFSTKLDQQPNSFFQVFLHIIRTLCGIWNLDFFRHLIPPFCVSSHLSNIQALTLEYVSIIYSFVLILVTYICIELHARNFKPIVFVWKPFHKCFSQLRRSWDPKASIINSFTTMFLIYFSKLIFIAGMSIFTTKVYGIPKHLHYLYFDSSIQLFSKQHLPYLSLSVLALSFVITVSLLLLVYPMKFFQRLLDFCFPFKCRLAVSTFVETIQGHYKDGTNGTKDYRALSGLQFCLQIVIVVYYLNAKFRFYFINSLQMSFLCFMPTCVLVKRNLITFFFVHCFL